VSDNALQVPPPEDPAAIGFALLTVGVEDAIAAAAGEIATLGRTVQQGFGAWRAPAPRLTASPGRPPKSVRVAATQPGTTDERATGQHVTPLPPVAALPTKSTPLLWPPLAGPPSGTPAALPPPQVEALPVRVMAPPQPSQVAPLQGGATAPLPPAPVAPPQVPATVPPSAAPAAPLQVAFTHTESPPASPAPPESAPPSFPPALPPMRTVSPTPMLAPPLVPGREAEQDGPSGLATSAFGVPSPVSVSPPAFPTRALSPIIDSLAAVAEVLAALVPAAEASAPLAPTLLPTEALQADDAIPWLDRPAEIPAASFAAPAHSRSARLGGRLEPSEPHHPHRGDHRTARTEGATQGAAQGPTEGDVFLDGVRVGRWMSNMLARSATRPARGTTGYDPRLGPRWPGALQGQ
jgi:hypothetical protein